MNRSKPPIGIGFVIGSLVRGGAEIHLSHLLPELAARGHEVSLLIIGPFGPIREDLRAAGIAVVPATAVQLSRHWPSWIRRGVRWIFFTLYQLRFAYRYRNGILHFFLPQATIFGGLTTIPWHRRLIASQRGLLTYRAKYPPFLTAIERWVLRNVSVVLANSRNLADALVADGVPPSKIKVLYNGLASVRVDPPDANRQKIRSDLEIGEGTFVIMTLANLFPYKGHSDLVEALGLLKANSALGNDWVLLCIGRDIGRDGREMVDTAAGSNQEHLELMAEQLGIMSHVRFLGDRADAPALLRAADLAVAPSHEEGFSNALLEEMAAGLPVVATDVGGNSEALDNGDAGVLVPAHNPAMLAEAIARLAQSPQMRLDLGTRARARVLSKYLFRQCVDEYEAVYYELLARRPNRLMRW